MRHLYSCPMRWADLDLLGHVNNVVYVDYLQEARVDLLRIHAAHTGDEQGRDDDLVEGVVVVRHEVQFVEPMAFREEPVSIECWVTDIRAASFTMAYEIFDPAPAAPSGRRVYARAVTLLTPYVFTTENARRLSPPEKERLSAFLEPTPPAERRPWGPGRRTTGGHYPVHVRFSDVDVYGHVNNVKYFEYFQEARIAYLSRLAGGPVALGGARPETMLVVAQKDVDYRAPILFRAEPYDAWSWVSRVGRSSYELCSEIRDGETLLSRCRAVCVTFDAETQRAVPPPEAYRSRLLAEIPR